MSSTEGGLGTEGTHDDAEGDKDAIAALAPRQPFQCGLSALQLLYPLAMFIIIVCWWRPSLRPVCSRAFSSYLR